MNKTQSALTPNPGHWTRISRKVAAATFAVGALFALSAPAQASDRDVERIAGTIVGAGIGALIGDRIGGHDGAKVGGIIGATFGLAASSNHRGHVRHVDHEYRYVTPAPRARHGDRHRGHKRAKFDRGYKRGFDEGMSAARGQTISHGHDIEYDLRHRHPRYVRGYRTGFSDGIEKVREIQRRRAQRDRRYQRRNGHGHYGHGHRPGYNNHGKVARVNKPIVREHTRPRRDRRSHSINHGRKAFNVPHHDRP